MKNIIIAFLLAFPAALLAQEDHDHSHGGHDHGGHEHGETITAEETVERRISESSSSKYEIVISYGDIHGGEEGALSFFISDVETNQALDSVDIKLTCPDMDNAVMTLNKKQAGWYEFKTTFPKDGHYNFHADVNGSLGSATLVLKDIEVGGHEHGTGSAEEHVSHWYSNPFVTFGGGALLVLLLLFISKKMKNKKAMAVFVGAMLFASQQTFSPTTITAQDEHGHDHGGGGAAKGALTDKFAIPKETQFLFDVRTTSIHSDSFSPARKVLGRVIAAPDGLAEVHAPQAARMGNVNVRLGQRVAKGEVLATVELIPDAGTQVTLLAALNEAKAEYEAAKNEVERLKSISDIASKKQQDEARARLEIASENKKLLEAGGIKSYTLKSPIAGVVEPFMATTGASIKPEDVLFSISNSENILIETQVYEEDLATIKQSPRFVVQCADQDHTLMDVKLESMGQRLNAVNQSQQVIFSVINTDGALRIGESVSVFVYENTVSGNHYVPNSALNEINGKPVVFVKESAEQFRIVYVAVGRDNGVYTEILGGLEEGERVITAGTYQVKMIFLNQ